MITREGWPIPILVDLHGPRIRVGKLPEPMQLVEGHEVVFAPEEIAGDGEIPTTYAELSHDVKPGAQILIDDGLLAVEVVRPAGEKVIGVVRHGGLLRPNKGMNLPGLEVSAPALTAKDREEVARVVPLGIDFIGLSFVRRPAELEELRSLVPPSVKLVAKIEKDTALANLSGIIGAADVIMVARGDLGVELPFEQVPLAQKQIIREAILHGKSVITATQMLESMIQAPRPTRAEASDVANAILDGTDAVMLSAETAVGSYPVESVAAMDRIAREVDRHMSETAAFSDAAQLRSTSRRLTARQSGQASGTEDAIAVAVSVAVDLLKVPFVVCFTSSGFTARTLASYRPAVPVVAFTPEPTTFRQLALVWGVVPRLVDRLPDYSSMWAVSRRQLVEEGLAAPGQRVVVTAGVPFDVPGTTNLLKVETL